MACVEGRLESERAATREGVAIWAELGRRAVLVIAPLVMLVALSQRWYFAESALGDVFRTRYPLTQDTLRVTLVCCIVSVAITLVLGFWLPGLVLGFVSVVLSGLALLTLIVGHGRVDFPNDPGGHRTIWYSVAFAAGVLWVVQSAALMVLAIGRSTPRIPRLSELFFVPPPSSTSRVAAVTGLQLKVWLGIVCAVGMFIGAFGPWAKALTLAGSVSVSGTDGSGDGWFVVVAAILAVLALLGAARRESAGLAAVASALGLASAAICIWDRHDFQFENESGLATAGWGVNLAAITSIGLAIFAALLIKRRPRGQAAPSSDALAIAVAATAAPTVPVTAAIAGYGMTESPEFAGRPAEHPDPVETPPSTSTTAELERLAELHDRGSLTDEEFSRAKQRLLGD